VILFFLELLFFFSGVAKAIDLKDLAALKTLLSNSCIDFNEPLEDVYKVLLTLARFFAVDAL
jgi:hypothetical protein